ncbi:MAG: prepilin-type N-terminal cleavage/methylation domain-containing protein [bacterium]|nr:prepilin-type N-terminal cleavage/methylation domain-containing protein [bacterium]
MKKVTNIKGFTLVELLVSISIFTVITSVAVFNHAQFNGSVLLTNLAYEIALSVRQAQFYGITVRQSTVMPGAFDSGYGIRFDLGESVTRYSLYEDRLPQNHVYDGAGELLESFQIQKGNRISKILVTSGSGSPVTANIVDISFIRPNPDTYITVGGNTSIFYSKAEICVSSPQGSSRIIVVEATGQISVTIDQTDKCSS